MDKAQLRRELQNYLVSMPPEQRAEKSIKACHNLVSTPQFQDASTIMMFLSLPHEIETSEAVLHAWQLDKRVAVPRISWEQRHMIAVRINSLDTDFSTSSSGLRNPITGVPTPFEEIDLVVTPALGFDKKGNRLGRGGCALAGDSVRQRGRPQVFLHRRQLSSDRRVVADVVTARPGPAELQTAEPDRRGHPPLVVDLCGSAAGRILRVDGLVVSIAPQDAADDG